ncbi:ATP-binding protein [Metabacillus idriensis]|uniref:ATP-binding protein n=1 Tax=Metabacillus idriensis TaxID=324768 RepID=UPI001747FF52|nr:ATP-binding protein [Metabacillus idriensis]
MKIIELPNGTQAQVAEYIEQDILEYRNNPFIEALGPILSQQEVIDKLSIYPTYNKEERFLEDHKRVHFVTRLLHYYQPMPIHLELQSSIDRLLRSGYIYRNPFLKRYAKDYVDNWGNIQSGSFDSSIIQTGQTLTIVGVSGVGKTRTLQRILDTTLPQVISHTSYKNKPLNMFQVSYLIIQTPFDGSVKTIIYDFMYQMDLLLGTNYFNRYANSRLSTSQLMPIMAQIAKNVGCLIIDELQHLREVKSKNSTQILNFFTTLINSINIPIIMISTPKGMSILQSQFRQARRNTNAGNIMWDRLKKDEVWDLFVQGLWKYQWTREVTHFSEEFSSLLFDNSQGVVDLAVKLYMMCQLRCISNGGEKITTQLILNVVENELKMVQPMLNALKTNNYKKLVDYDDLVLPDIEKFLEREQIIINQKQVMESLKQGVDRNDKRDKLVEDAVFRLNILGISDRVARETIAKIMEQSEEIRDLSEIVQKAFRILTIPDTTDTEVNTADLRKIVETGRESGVSAYKSLYDAGFIKQDYAVSDAS